MLIFESLPDDNDFESSDQQPTMTTSGSKHTVTLSFFFVFANDVVDVEMMAVAICTRFKQHMAEILQRKLLFCCCLITNTDGI